MALSIGLFTLVSGVLCMSEPAAKNFADTLYNREGKCGVVESMPLMPQEVVYKNNLFKVVRMGTKTDPVMNFWLVIPTTIKVTGEPVEQ